MFMASVKRLSDSRGIFGDFSQIRALISLGRWRPRPFCLILADRPGCGRCFCWALCTPTTSTRYSKNRVLVDVALLDSGTPLGVALCMILG